MKVRFALRASLFLRSEFSYIARFNRAAARAAIALIHDAASMLGEYPHAGAPIAVVANVRRYTAAPYHIDYIVEADAVVIIAIRHGRQNDASIEIDEDGDFETGDGSD